MSYEEPIIYAEDQYDYNTMQIKGPILRGDVMHVQRTNATGHDTRPDDQLYGTNS